MHPTPSPSPSAQQSSFSEPVELLALVGKLEQKILTLRRQVAWFQRQIFGQKSEKHTSLNTMPCKVCWASALMPCLKPTDSSRALPDMGALAHIREWRVGLEVYRDDADVAIDTNHLERALRVIPMGRRNWLFAWTELGAKQIGIVQSLLTICRLYDINPCDYFVDVLQRIDQHPAALVEQLTPWRRKERYASNLLRSDLHLIRERQAGQ